MFSDQSDQKFWETESGTEERVFVGFRALPERSDGNRLTFCLGKMDPGRLRIGRDSHNNHIQKRKMPSLMPGLLPGCTARPKHGASAGLSRARMRCRAGGRWQQQRFWFSRVRVKVGRDRAGTAWCWKRERCPDQSREAGRKRQPAFLTHDCIRRRNHTPQATLSFLIILYGSSST